MAPWSVKLVRLVRLDGRKADFNSSAQSSFKLVREFGCDLKNSIRDLNS